MSDIKNDIAVCHSLSETPKYRRAKEWKDTLCGFFYDYEAKLQNDFEIGEITGCYTNGLSVASVKSDAMSVWRTEKQISRDGIDAYFMLLPNDTSISLSQRGRESFIGSQEYALVSTSCAYTYLQPDTAVFNNLIIPGGMLRDVAPYADDMVSCLSGAKGVERAFRDLANSLCFNFQDMGPSIREYISKQAVELLGLALDGADRQSNATPIRLAHRRRIMSFIEQNFADPALNIHMIANKLQISTRYIQNVFHETSETVTGVIRKRRIQEACRLIGRRRNTHMPISDIAYRVGFRDLPHFCRVFKQETGFRPSDFGL